MAKPKAPKKYRQAKADAKKAAKGVYSGKKRAVAKDPFAKTDAVAKKTLSDVAKESRGGYITDEKGNKIKVEKGETYAERTARERETALRKFREGEAADQRAAEIEKRMAKNRAATISKNAEAKAEARAAGRKGSPLVQTANADRAPKKTNKPAVKPKAKAAKAGSKGEVLIQGKKYDVASGAADKKMKELAAEQTPKSTPTKPKANKPAPAKPEPAKPVATKPAPAPKKPAAKPAPKTAPKPAVVNARTQAAKGAAKAASPKVAARFALSALSPKKKIGLGLTAASLVAEPVINALSKMKKSESIAQYGARRAAAGDTTTRAGKAQAPTGARSKLTQAKQDAAMAARGGGARPKKYTTASDVASAKQAVAKKAAGVRLGAGGTTIAPAIGKQEAAMASRAGVSPAKGSATGNVYRVNQGDTLEAIAKKAGVSLAELKKANPKAFAQKYIYRNTKVNIPTGGKVPSGGYSGPVPYKPSKKK